MTTTTTRVRVLPERALSLSADDKVGAYGLYVAGDELDLPDDAAQRLTAAGFVKPVS